LVKYFYRRCHNAIYDCPKRYNKGKTFWNSTHFEGKLYIQTGRVKDVSKQIHANPKVEICAFKNGEWLKFPLLKKLLTK